MNAYELADELRFVDAIDPNDFIKDAMDMLRQQADRIAELEVTKFHLEGDVNRLEDQVNELLVKQHFTTPQIKELSPEVKQNILDIWKQLQPHLFPKESE